MLNTWSTHTNSSKLNLLIRRNFTISKNKNNEILPNHQTSSVIGIFRRMKEIPNHFLSKDTKII